MGNLKKLQVDGVDVLPLVSEYETYDSEGNSISNKYANKNTVSSQMVEVSNKITNANNQLTTVSNYVTELVNKYGDTNNLSTNSKDSMVSALNNIYSARDNVKQQIVNALSEKGVTASTSESIESLINKINTIEVGNDIPEWYIPTNPYSNTWNQAATSPYSNLWPGEYYYLELNTMTAVNDKIYCIGGTLYHSSEYNELKIVYCYDVKTNQWTQLSNYTAGTVSGHSATYVNGYIYVIGGYINYGTDNTKYGLVYRYNISTGQWGSRRSMTYPIMSHCAEVIGTNIYTFGGYERVDNSYDYNYCTFMYSTTGNAWTTKQNSTPFYDQEYNHILASGTINDIIYVFLPYLGKIYSYEYATDTWTEKATLMDSDQFSYRPHSAVSNNKLYLISINIGADGDDSNTYHMAYDPITNTATNKSVNLTLSGDYGIYISGGDAVTASDGCIYTICNYGNTYCYIP